jgi:hypothetical protein
MASKNTLLGSGVTKEQTNTTPEQPCAYTVPCWLYNGDVSTGKIVKTEEALANLLDAGWKEHPEKEKTDAE